ncbi:MAG TPA: hypothetical protein VJ724_12645 [Tahibacter sp.]|nr:hypothetical protein [Tahibacter sp.]
MPRTPIAFVFVLASAACGAQALMPDPAQRGKTPPTADELKQIETIRDVGREIYRQDQLAWHATDAAIAKIGERRMHAEVGGWVVTTIDGGSLVTFVRREPKSADDEVLAEVRMLDGKRKPVVDKKVKRTLSPTERTLIAARNTAMAKVPVPCSRTYNTATLPTPNGDWDVYALAGTTDASIVPVGGHARITVSADGTKVLGVEPYSKGCLDLTKEPPPKGAEPFLFMTHIVGDLPAPTHVFLSLTHGTRMHVLTPRHHWIVAGDAIVAVPADTAEGDAAESTAAKSEP